MKELTGAGPRPVLQLPLRLSERQVLLTGLDLMAVNGALYLALASRLDLPFDWRVLSTHPLWVLIVSVIWLSMAHTFDAYEPTVTGRLETSLLATLKAGLVTSVLYLLIPHITPPLPTSRMALVTFPLLVVALLLAERCLYALVVPQPAFRQRALIIGAGLAGRTIARVLAYDGDVSHQVIGFIDDDPEKQGTIISVPGLRKVDAPGTERTPVHLRVLGNRDAIRDLIEHHHISTLILAITHKVESVLLQTLLSCVEQGIEVVPMTMIYERVTGRVPVEHVGDNWYIAMPIEGRGNSPFWRFGKRLMDIVLAVLGLLCMTVVLPFIALAIFLDSPGTIFYVQERVGRGGKIFRTYKFRSMVSTAENGTAVWARENDPRATRVGRILRATHLDEWPQFLNVLRGEMSVVGPRPERPELAGKLAVEIPFYRLRHIVKPGMGGWGLVRQGYAGSQEDAMVRLQYDLYYIKHQSLWLDTVILLKTIAHALTFRGR